MLLKEHEVRIDWRKHSSVSFMRCLLLRAAHLGTIARLFLHYSSITKGRRMREPDGYRTVSFGLSLKSWAGTMNIEETQGRSNI